MQSANGRKSLLCMPDSFFRIGLAAALQQAGYVVHLADCPRQITEECARVDLLVVGGDEDHALCDQVVCCLEKSEPKTVVVMVTVIKRSEAHKLRTLGAKAILSCDSDPVMLTIALDLLEDHVVVNTSILVSDGLASASLTAREWQVLALLAMGFQGKDIARVLELSPKTVDAHKGNLMRKLDVHSLTGLVSWFNEYKNLCPLPDYEIAT